MAELSRKEQLCGWVFFEKNQLFHLRPDLPHTWCFPGDWYHSRQNLSTFFFEQSLWTATLTLQLNNSNLVRQIWILNDPVHQPWSVGHDRTLDWPYLNDKHLNSTRFHHWSPKKLNLAHFNENQKGCHKNINIEVFCVFPSLTQAPCVCEQRTAPNSKHVGAPQLLFSTQLSHTCAT